MSFTIFPAIDLRGGKVVRLLRGDPNAQTVYSSDPGEVARRWADEGASWLHVVNLDGALAEGREPGAHGAGTASALIAIRGATTLPIQFGGGLRTMADIERAFAAGATRVVLGTVAVQSPEIVRAALACYGAARIVVGIDTRSGIVATHGWQRSGGLDAHSLARHVAALGIERLVFTDIARDGTLSGANLGATRELARGSGLKVIASGGIGHLADLEALARCSSDGIEGAIIGQALYTSALTLKQALAFQGSHRPSG